MIAGAFYRRGIIETWGRGTLKIARLMREAGHAPPTVSLRDGAVVVTFVLPGKAPGKTLRKTPEKTPRQSGTPEKTLDKVRVKTPEAILEMIREGPELSVAEMAIRLDRSESAVNRAIRQLRESGRLQRIGPDKGGHWKVNR